ncbi:MAG: hypothetical protein WCK84_02115 [Bacteroidota bacterium]
MKNYFFYILFCTSLVLTWFFHKEAIRFSDRSVVWSDRAGYYIYLPATFFYHFDTHKMPADLDVKTGGGFSIDTRNNKIDTKYTYGVALLASPFFLASGFVSSIAGYDNEGGFSMLYMRMISLAAVVYLILGLWFLKKFLDYYFQPAVNFFVITLIFFGTNLFYYSLIDAMMSHVYSFFLFALFLFLLKKFQLSGSWPYFILLSITLSLAILIRPTNILLGLLFFVWDASSTGECIKRVKQFLNPLYLLCFMAILLIVFMPQFFYWKYLSGNWLHFSYHHEGFTNWSQPRIAEVLFSPLNGLITYVPLVLIFLSGIIIMLFRKRQNGLLIAGVFIVLTIICASWESWYFGCSYGQRSYIEYFTILAVPFGYFTTELFNARKFWLSVIIFFFIFLFTYFNLRLTCSLYRFEQCYYGSTWDWDHFRRSIERAGIISPVHKVQSHQNDFENLALSPVVKPSDIFTRSGQYSIATIEKKEQTQLFSIRLNEIGYPWPKIMDVEVWALKPGYLSTGASLSYALKRGPDILFSDEQPIDSLVKNPMTWSKVCKTFIIPDVNDSSLQISIYIHNPRRALLFFDDLMVKYHYRWN